MIKNILQSFKSESAPCIKLLSLIKKRVDSESLKWVIFKTNPKLFHIDINMKHKHIARKKSNILYKFCPLCSSITESQKTRGTEKDQFLQTKSEKGYFTRHQSHICRHQNIIEKWLYFLHPSNSQNTLATA